MQANLQLDMHLARHLPALYRLIRKRGLVAYFAPYSRADLHLMAKAFNTSADKLEDELLQLILDDKIQVNPLTIIQ